MSLVNRVSLVTIACAAGIAAGCGGGGGGGEVASPPTPMPAVASRPLAAGDAFSYAGSTVDAKVFSGSNPPGSSTTTATVAQAITVSGPTSFNGLSGAFDFKTAETDTTALRQIGTTIDTFYATAPAGTAGFTDLVTSGFTSSDTLGEKTTVALGAGNRLVDVLPELARQWTDDGSQTIATTEADGTSETRTYASDGSYADTTTFPQTSQFTPQPAPLVATIVENRDGSGTYALPLFGSSPDVTIAFGTPDPSGRVPIVVSNPEPIASATPLAFYSPGPLYAQTDTTSVGRAIPPACHVAATYGTVANAIVESSKRVDTVLGTIETLAQTSYVVPTFGVACIQLTDTTDTYYDYSGQSNTGPIGIAFDGGPNPVEVDTVTTTLGLTSAAVVAQSSYRIANARAIFSALVERARSNEKKRAIAHVRAALRRLVK